MPAIDGAGRPNPEVVAAARALRLRVELLLPLAGATGCTWAVSDLVLGLGRPATTRREVLAMTAAASAVPVPDILNVLDPGGGVLGDVRDQIRPVGGEPPAHQVLARCGGLVASGSTRCTWRSRSADLRPAACTAASTAPTYSSLPFGHRLREAGSLRS